MDKYFEYERAYKSRPHVVLLGAGASVAAIPRGDKNGMKTSVMDGFLEKLGLSEVITDLNLVTQSDNLEDIYSEIAERDEYADVRSELDTRIRNYFSEFEIPDEPTIYDFLLLSLRKKDSNSNIQLGPSATSGLSKNRQNYYRFTRFSVLTRQCLGWILPGTSARGTCRQ
ncbi:hypothetical protein ABF162_25405 (plasmid) [Vibrio coralliilyticus]|uniref:hypothetical protein n=1 Tax=Vibrio coralliilyticus TaxID=190893 RepID=UPI00345E0C14